MNSAGRSRLLWLRSRSGRGLIAVLLLTGLILATATLRNAGLHLVVSVPVDGPDAIVSLASHEWERLPVAARFAAKFPGSRIVLTDPPRSTWRNCYNCANRVDDLQRLGVDRARVIVVPIVESNTYGEALAVRDLARRLQFRRILIVTSTYHTRRALATFRRVLASSGITLGVQPADVSAYAHPSRWWAWPYDRWYVAYEWSALVWYRVHHGVPLFGSVQPTGPGRDTSAPTGRPL